MRLTKLSDYALRVLMYAEANKDQLITIEETSRVYNISRTHLMKVVNILVREGFLKGVRGRSGGFTLGKDPKDINIGAVIRATEPDFALVECFLTGNQCNITGSCKLPNIFNEAVGSFLATLEKYTLADIVLQRRKFNLSRLDRTADRQLPTDQ
ncbi:MAG: Rrf2 family transcriptional regulator [Novosphingobium sp.]|nr:Rrf2 family transcriptional regulator [Alphaproteobacteria bacterium]MCP5403760.1 Rrf2 family transcriptional regulator [Novosphingobium sp.]